MATSVATFRAKTNFMKSWRPRDPPSNRDRLELYALHKQAVAGDAPPHDGESISSGASVAERSKRQAWRAKRGMARDVAMARYVEECDRQLRVYGVRDYDAAALPPPAHARQGMAAAIAEPSATPQNTPATAAGAAVAGGDGEVLLCPRGLAAVPLLCAAAAESRVAYLARLQVTDPANGWWAKQEPLCLEIDNPLSMPEKLVIAIAAKVEQLSLLVSRHTGEGRVVPFLSPQVLQAFLWPVHNVLLCCWITLILTSTCLGSMAVMCQTVLFGARRTDAPLGRLLTEEVRPSARAMESLCGDHQALGVRLAGLALMPLMTLCDFAASAAGRAGELAGSLAFVGLGACGWWYWLCVLPWLAMCGLSLALMSGWCFGLIELAAGSSGR